MLSGVHLSRLTKLAVVSSEREPLGRLVDVSANLSSGVPRLHRLVVGSGRQLKFVVPWSLVATMDDLEIRLSACTDSLDPFRVARGTDLGEMPLDADEVMLVSDVMDSQVVDLAGLRLARVSDVLLAENGSAMNVVGADLGFGALLRRMGFVRLGDRMKPVLVAWDDLHLASPRGHTVQLAVSTSGLRTLDPTSVAEVLSRLATDPATDVLRTIGPARAASALEASHDIHRRRLMGAMPSEEAHRLIDSASLSVGRALRRTRDESKTMGRRFRRTVGWRGHRPKSREAPDE